MALLDMRRLATVSTEWKIMSSEAPATPDPRMRAEWESLPPEGMGDMVGGVGRGGLNGTWQGAS